MHNTCYSSTLSLRCKGSISFSYNDNHRFLNDGIGRNPIHPQSSSCCSCCTNSIYREPLNPSILYGLRQSTLIQWSPCKRLILGGGDRYYYRFPAYDVDRSCDYGKRSVGGRRGKWREGKFGCMVSEDLDDVEVMLSLLTEVSEECLGVRERKGSSSRRVQVEKRENSGKKKNVGSGLLESSSRCEFESVKIQPKGENYRRKEDRGREEKEIFSRGENRRVRKEGSSCSSYYSLSSSGEVESDNEVQVENEGVVEESSSRYKGDLRQSEEIIEGGHERENSAVGSYKLASGLECDWRKKSEKKLSETSTEQSESSKNLSQKNSRLVEVHESDYGKTSGSHKQFDNREERSKFSVNIDEGRRKQYKSTSQQVTGESESRMKYKRFGDREENLGAAVSLVAERENDHRKTDTRITKQDESRWKSQQLDEASEIQEIGFKGTSTSQGMKDQHYQESVQVTGKIDSRRKSEQLTEISHTHDSDIVNTSTLKRKSDTRMKKQEAKADMVLSSSSEVREQRSQTGHKETRRMESSRKSQDNTNTQRASENRMSSQEIHSTSVEEMRKIRNVTDERVLEIGSRKEDQMLTKASSFSGGFSKEASSSSKSSLPLKPQAKVQEINVDEEDNRNLQTIVMAPSSQLVERGPYSVSPARSHAESQPWQSEIHGESRRDEIYGITSHGDALVSADRMQKFSTQFISEFAEKVKHESSSSETKIGMKSSETNLVSLGQKSQYGSGDSESKKQESRHSSRSSGTKGPSDEMWDAMDPSIRGPPKTEVLSGTTTTTTTTTTENAVSKRTGKSLWNIIGDIVRLRWAPRSDSPNLAAKSGGKSSPNQSVSSETWFSGHEQDENNDDNVKEHRNDPLEPESFGQQKEGKVTAKSPEEGSSSRSSKDKIRHVGADKLSSSSILESGSASKSISSASGDENIGSKEDRKNFLSTTSGTAVLELSVQLPAGPTRSPVVEEISEAGQTEEISGTGAKEGELKRRKFQRTNQVVKDRFDDWEEAYILESEQRKIDEMFMREALLEAQKAADVWEVPVGAVLVQHGKIIARGYNLVEELRDSTAHAEMICIREASNVLRTWRLSETTLYVTLEPCPMCAGAILQARVDTVVWGAPNKLLGADGSWIRLFPNGGEGGNDLDMRDKPAAPVHPFHPKITIRRGVLATECSDEMQQFFQLRRRKKEKKEDTSPSSSSQPTCLPISHHPSKLLTKMHDAFHLMFCL